MILDNIVIHFFPLSRAVSEIITLTPPFSTRWRCKWFHPVAHSHITILRRHSYEDSCSHSVVKRVLVTAAGAPIGDALATMGSVQVIPITQVLYQPTGNLLNIVEASPILQQLSQALKAASLNWVISGSGPLTFFAPSDTAFQSLTPEQRKNLIEDKQAFTDLIKRHLLRGTFFSSGVQEDLQKTSEKNTPMTLSLQEGQLRTCVCFVFLIFISSLFPLFYKQGRTHPL
ncbi:hypothetical protein AVEN_248763-1 [Araneus ventricosus]|uniref:FAS1 domain-containing protein n=1 Tax=Araneus ventricosus TaxID=182803 RepID=A0A4Y2LUT2_ARAVE|nr:hypothetical protein AVEN_248763-1 [Araneus ventricosus]